MKVNIIGKENEPADLYNDYGHFLPPLETWLYITPIRDNWETMDPKEFNKNMLITRPYDRHDWIDYEDISITASQQTAILKKLRKYSLFKKYIVLFEDSAECTDWIGADSFIENTDYTINEIRSEFLYLLIALTSKFLNR